MISFRYHLVSIVAVLLALAVGLAVGTTALGGPVLDDLDRRVSDLSDDKRGLEADLAAAARRGAAQDEAARLLAPGVVRGRLAGQRVVLVSTPEAPAALREQLTPLLVQAGATVGASVRLRPALFDPANGQQVADLVAQVAVPGADLPEGEPLEQALAQLAQVLVRRSGAVPAADDARRVLSAYQGEELLEVEGAPDQPGTLALLLTGAPAAGTAAAGGRDAAEARTRALLGLARALDVRSSGAVVAGPPEAAAGAGLLLALREDGATSDRVSSVDAAGDRSRGARRGSGAAGAADRRGRFLRVRGRYGRAAPGPVRRLTTRPRPAGAARR